jgi:hypothetical protein
MSRLTRILVTGADGLKGQTFDQPLAGVDVFAGPNGAGKTTRLLAISAGLRNLADTPSDATRDYLGPTRPHAVVSLDWSDGRRLTRDLSASIRSRTSRRDDGISQALAGPQYVRWDLGDFANASESDRAKLVERVCIAAGVLTTWTRERVAAEVLAPLEKAHPALATMKAALSPALWDGRPEDVPGWLPRALALARDEYTEANAAQAAATKQAQGYADEPGPPPPAGTLPGARAELERVEGQLRAARVAVQAIGQASGAQAKHEAEGVRIAGALEASRLALEARQDEVRAAGSVLGANVADYEATLNGAVDAATEAHHLWRAAAARVETLTATLADMNARANTPSRCRHCNGEDPLGASDRPDEYDIEAMTAALSLARRWARRYKGAQSECVAAEQKAAAALQAARAANLAHHEHGARAQHALDVQAAVHAGVNAALAAWRDRAPVAPSTDQALAFTDPESLQAEVDALDGQARNLRADVELHIRAQERERGMQEAIARREAAVARFTGVKALGEALKGLQARVAVDVFGPLCAQANVFLAAVAPELAVVFRSAGDFGATWARPNGTTAYVPFWSLSDSDRALVSLALAAAVATLTKAPWRAVVADRFEIVDEARRPRVLAGLARLVATGALDNVALALVAAARPVSMPEGVTVHWLGGAT